MLPDVNRRYPSAAACIILFLAAAGAAQPSSRPSSVPTAERIRAQTLDQMYRRELGTLYRATNATKLFQTHQAIEDYFAATTGAARQQAVRTIESVGLDANIVGRLTRLHMDWPALAGGVYYINERVGPHDVHYFLGIPKTYDRTIAWPLVIKLPAPDAFAGDPKPNADDVTQFYTTWMNEELTRHPDAIVIMPLLNLDELWGPSYNGMNAAMQPMLHVMGRANIDPARVYMIGHSLSAIAIWNLALNSPTYFAAFNPLSGGAGNDWQRLRLTNLHNVLPVVWHDADDTVIKVDNSRQLVNVLRRLKVDVDYNETKKIGHVPNDAIVEAEYAKLRARTRELYPRQIFLQSNRPETIFNRIDWLQVYQPMNAGEEKRLLFRKGTGHMIVTANAWSAQANLSRDNNRIDVTTDNVAILRIYVNDRMIDFGRSFSVFVNKKGKFEGFVKPSIDQLLKDQLFLGRGWRYFTGVIDIDLTAGGATTNPTTRDAISPSPTGRGPG
jgi:hypothetical protein